jgi:hypothetical protein
MTRKWTYTESARTAVFATLPSPLLHGSELAGPGPGRWSLFETIYEVPSFVSV